MSDVNMGILMAQAVALIGQVLAYFATRGQTEVRRDERRDAATAHIEEHADTVADNSREMFIGLNTALMETLTATRAEVAAARAEAAETRQRVDELIAHVARLEAQLMRHGVEVPERPSFRQGAQQ